MKLNTIWPDKSRASRLQRNYYFLGEISGDGITVEIEITIKPGYPLRIKYPKGVQVSDSVHSDITEAVISSIEKIAAAVKQANGWKEEWLRLYNGTVDATAQWESKKAR
jgi:hypothetical protein